MPEEPNQKMDALLKVYAEKRRAEAGAPLDLHPATRKMLQSEVARTLGKKDTGEPRRKIFAAWWLRLAMGGAAVVILAIAISRTEKPKSMEMAKSDVSLGAPRLEKSPAPALAPAQERQFATAKLETGKDLEHSGKKVLANAPAPVQATNATFTVTASGSAPLSYQWKTDGLDMTNKLADWDESGKHLAAKDRVDSFFGTKLETGAGRTSDKGIQTDGFAVNSTTTRFGLETNFYDSLAPTPSIKLTNAFNFALSEAAQPAREKAPAGEFAKKELASRAEPTGRIQPGTPSASPLSASETPAKALAKSDADQTVAPARTTRGLVTYAFQTPPAAQVLSDAISNLDSPTRLNFVQNDLRARYRKNVQSPPLPQLLNSFQIERHGDELQVVDGDGSVYRGEILRANATTEEDLAAKKPAEVASKKSGTEAKQKTAETLVRQQNLSNQNAAQNFSGQNESFSFRVSGLNRPLQQKIIFVGTFTPEPDSQTRIVDHVQTATAAAAAPAQQKESLPPTPVVVGNSSIQSNGQTWFQRNSQSNVQQSLPQNGRVNGKVQIGRATEFEIEANQMPASR